MPYYRFITEEELAAIRRNQGLLPQGHYPPYKPNEIICNFVSADLPALFKRYGTGLTEQREMGTGKKLIAIEVVGFQERSNSISRKMVVGLNQGRSSIRSRSTDYKMLRQWLSKFVEDRSASVRFTSNLKPSLPMMQKSEDDSEVQAENLPTSSLAGYTNRRRHQGRHPSRCDRFLLGPGLRDGESQNGGSYGNHEEANSWSTHGEHAPVGSGDLLQRRSGN